MRYLRYVILHKTYVLAAGIAINRRGAGWSWLPWLWRLVRHDWSKFRPSEWRPYAAYFYGPTGTPETSRALVARFNVAWLLHIHRNPHHWQHWILHEDSGKVLVLLPDAVVADEMLADWIGAGTKILARPTLAECVASTIVWYRDNRQRMQLREPVRQRIEQTLLALAQHYGLVALAQEVRAAQAARASITIPGR